MTFIAMAPSRPQLRPYQIDAIAAIEQARAAGEHVALIVQPTGTGKTVTFSELVRRWNVPTLILAHREELLTQAREKVQTIWPEADIGLIGAGRDERGHQITIASVQSIVRPARLAQLVAARLRLVVVDEAHHVTAASYRKILTTLRAGTSAGPFLLGVTATPQRADRKDITAVLGAPVYSVGLAEMVQAGYLCDLRGIQVRTAISLDDVGSRAGDFSEEQLSAAVNRPDRNRVIVDAYRRHAEGRPAIAFAVDVQHAHDLAETFREAGIGCEALDGMTSRERRQQILADYAAGRLKVITNCAVLTEGFDAPATAAVILARPTQARGLYVQMVGRGARPAPGKIDCLIIDVADNTVKHNLVVQSLPQLVGRAGYGLASQFTGDSGDPESSAWSLRDAIEADLPTAKPGRLIERTANLLGKSFTWERLGGGHYRLAVSGATLALMLCDTGYMARLCWPDGARQDLTSAPVTLDWAQAVAERAATQIAQGQAHLVDNRAPWRLKPASEKQTWMLRKLHIKAKTGITSGEASDLINAALSAQRTA